jgi:NAD-dependent oxidoreductase involved in siderophore biosynthesis
MSFLQTFSSFVSHTNHTCEVQVHGRYLDSPLNVTLTYSKYIHRTLLVVTFYHNCLLSTHTPLIWSTYCASLLHISSWRCCWNRELTLTVNLISWMSRQFCTVFIRDVCSVILWTFPLFSHYITKRSIRKYCGYDNSQNGLKLNCIFCGQTDSYLRMSP